MTPLGPVTSLLSGQPQIISPVRTPALPDNLTPAPAGGGDFRGMLDTLVSAVSNQQAKADAVTNQVLLGDSGQLHQSIIAMQEASTSLSLMVQVRNKLVESYQELMHMQV
jgi:flagellar hook-basal body complex protein FliE